MNKSMTGYGQTRYEDENYSINAEVKTLNSKFLDVTVRIPKSFNDKEIYIRNIISEKLQRGKVTIVLEFSNKKDTTAKVKINEKLFREYYDNLKSLSDGVASNSEDLFKMAVMFPDVIETMEDDSNREEEWQMILPVINSALDKCDDFRIKEGAVLSENLRTYVESIRKYLDEVCVLDPQRIQRIKSRLNENLKEFALREELDINRLEQELIYYIEKLDISEEQVRLTSHLDYFLEILNMDKSMGKKMNFISQEIGREINTIGSKSNDAVMQKLVVNMKEELEKIKEQVLNIL
jgi:uncharacterized protein (TIGR00255 family)